MTKQVLTQAPPILDVLETVYRAAAAENYLPEETASFEQVINSLNLPTADYDRLWSAVFLMVADAKEAAFKIGWQYRAQV